METILEKNKIINDIENEQEINLILDRQKEASEGKTMSLDNSIKEFINKRNAWKSIL